MFFNVHSKMETNKIIQGDCLEVLKTLPDESVDSIITSPPYWNLRDYGVEGQLGLECVSSDTEILTKYGWKTYKELKEKDDVATFNIKDEKIEYQQIKRKFIKNYEGDITRIKNFHLDMLLTPNHRVLHKNRLHSGISDWKYIFADKLEIKKGLIIPTSFEINGELSIGEDLAELIGWILTDGTLSVKRGYRITIYQSKEEGIERIEYLLKKLDISYKIHKRKERTNYSNNPKERYYFRFSGIKARSIRGLIGDKQNPSNELLFLKKNELQRLFKGIFYGDGSGQSIYGKPETFRDWLQRLCLHLGLRTIWNDKKIAIEFSNNNTTEISRVNKRKNPKLEPYGISKEKYKGIVWCVQTENSNFVARRNKQIFITGNSTFEEYITKLCDIFDEVKRVLKKEGTCFVNLGDTYSTQSGAMRDGKFGPKNTNNQSFIQPKTNLPDKSLCNIPGRFSIEMQNSDTTDIYELDERYLNKEVFIISDNITEDAIQRQKESTGIQYPICSSMEIESQTAIPEKDEGLGGEKQRQSQKLQQEILLSEQRKGSNPSYERKCEETSQIKDRSIDSLRGESSNLQMLWRVSFAIFNNRPYRWEWCETSKGNKTRNLRMVIPEEIPPWLSNIMYELQLGKKQIQDMSSSRGKKFTIRKRDIPIELKEYFKLIKEERWCLRNKIIWHKPNAMPSSVKDRFNVDYEEVFFFVKSKKYFFDVDSIREPHGKDKRMAGIRRARELGYDGKGSYQDWYDNKREKKDWVNKKETKDNLTFGQAKKIAGVNPPNLIHPLGRNKRCVWTIPTKPFKEAHFATFPMALIEPMVKAGCPENGIILDPFMGAGTTALVAIKNNRNFLGIELNPEYIKLAEKRLKPFLEQQRLNNE